MLGDLAPDTTPGHRIFGLLPFDRIQSRGLPSREKMLRDVVRLGERQVNPRMMAEPDLQLPILERYPDIITGKAAEARGFRLSDLSVQLDQGQAHALPRQLQIILC